MDLIRRTRHRVLALLLVACGILVTFSYLYARTSLLAVGFNKKREPYHTSVVAKRRFDNDINDVQTFVFFVGYPRSGHSIIASMIDAHPNAILAHEFNIFPQLIKSPHTLLTDKTRLYSNLYDNSHTQSSKGWRSMDHSFTQKGYNLKMNSSSPSWQGRYRRLRVIGDKSGGITVRMYRKDPKLFTKLYNKLTKLVQVPIKILHIVRNPYDMIATRLLYRFSQIKRQKANFTTDNPLDSRGNVTQAMNSLYTEALAVNNMTAALRMSVLEIHNKDFIHSPRKEMKRICAFIGLQCSAPYLDMCARSTFDSLSVTRRSVVWSKEARKFIDTNIMALPFFKRYSFELD